MITVNSFTDANESRPTLLTDPQPSPNIFNGGGGKNHMNMLSMHLYH